MRTPKLSTASLSRDSRESSSSWSSSSRFCSTASRFSYDLTPPGSYDRASLRSSSSFFRSASTRSAWRAFCSEMVRETFSAAGYTRGGGGGVVRAAPLLEASGAGGPASDSSPEAPSSKHRPPTTTKLSSSGTELVYAQGYDVDVAPVDAALVNEALAAAQSADVAVVLVGLTGADEAEAVDRAHMDMPPQMDALVAAVAAAQPKTVVVLCNGSPVTMPWLNDTAAVLEMYLGGQASGAAMADLIFGRVTPCGKLAETFPLAAEDCASHAHFMNHPSQVSG